MEYIIYGCIGGLFPDILRIIKNRYEPSLPNYLKSGNFYLGLVLLILLGGFLVYLKAPEDIIEALAIGYSGPQIFSSLTASVLAKKDSNEETRGLGNTFHFISRWWQK
jgi:hypothetical protein